MDSEFFQPVYPRHYGECLSPTSTPSFFSTHMCTILVAIVVLIIIIIVLIYLFSSRKKKAAAAAIEEEDIQFINPYQDQQWAGATPQPGTSKPAGATTGNVGKPITDRPATDRPVTNSSVADRPVMNSPVTDRLIMATGGPAAASAASAELYTTATTQNTASQTMPAVEALRQRSTYTHKDLENSL
ncbi:pE183L [African swine fever virus]|uniref:Inner membrane protein p54 n=16 Tax=African swine fever virus TaxID=10497 RepID=B7TBE9_ASF|nr:BA71V-E183L (p54, j13L) [African swine fever virus]UYB79279.1 p54 [Recombinant African swine fever virus]ACJ39050.1 structural protein p54 [African swine fever virus]ACJ39051.1 structural protein p54 [African swine fever virus]ACJ39052.1 structural protein p54 [African swine fever virus]ACJ39053.1 structural protein p54 [African swine fever virus]